MFKFYLSYVIPLLIVGISACTSMYNQNNLDQYAPCSTPECINDGLVDTSQVDFAAFKKKINEFFTDVDTTKRANSSIDSILNRLYPVIKAGLIEAIKNDTAKKHYHLYVRPDGLMRIEPSCRSDGDTNAINLLNTKIASPDYRMVSTEKLWVIRGINILDDSIIVDSLNVYSFGPYGRSKKTIMEVVVKYSDKFKILYNRRVHQQPGIKGRITTQIAVDYFGRVIRATIISSTVKEPLLEQAVLQQIRHWKFSPVLLVGDITEFIYPFAFDTDNYIYIKSPAGI